MHEEIGTVAGAIWHVLNSKGALSLAQLKREVKGKTPLFDWAIGWLAREEDCDHARQALLPHPA